MCVLEDLTVPYVSPYRIFVHFEAIVHGSIILLLPPTTRVSHTGAVLLHGYCTIHDSSPTPLSKPCTLQY